MTKFDQQADIRRSIRPPFRGAPVSPTRIGRSCARARVYCLPHAGGAAGMFRTWPELLPTDIEICAVEYPGHGSRLGEPLLETIEQVARSVADLVAAGPSEPYALFGHSMGSLVAFEACHLLAARGSAMPRLLIASGHRAPKAPQSTPPMHAAPHAEFIAHLRQLGATPPEVFRSPDLLELVLPILRADFRACETYRPRDRSKLRIDIAAYGGFCDEDTGRDELLAWQQETTGECVVRMFPGGHFFVLDCADRVVAMLERDLAKAISTEPATPCVTG
ncbi:medium-chain acyl-[acyl-carrier-protein] hydrolase [Bradyrhizobium sp. AZCC 1719]|uniref:thioesterase II family protein n=1 Tax=Bradyrhizobium sp. AZCC 1719 TaxID=3117028 RepID=UPI002FF3CC72